MKSAFLCDKVTPILKKQLIEYRNFNIRGCGQLNDI